MNSPTLCAAFALSCAATGLSVHAETTADLPRGASLLAHRGLAQGFSREGIDMQTCTAARMLPPTHAFMENTLDSMRAAFELGADVVEMDVHPTTDGDFVVFHDWTLECRTNGEGVTREHTLAYLKALDIGYGYTADGGATFPFRGRFVGAMPTLAEVVAAFRGKRFLVNVKGNTREEGESLVAYLRERGLEKAGLMFYGGEKPISVIREALPGTRTMSRPHFKSCIWRYVLVGWSGYVPDACRNTVLIIPSNYQWAAWGWPEKFLERMAKVNSEVFLVRPLNDEMMKTLAISIDDVETLAKVSPRYRGGIWTDRIDVLGPILRPAARRSGGEPSR